MAVHVWEYAHPVLVGPAVVTMGVIVPSQLSVPVNTGAVTVGLHPRLWLVAVVVITGAVLSCVHVKVMLTGVAAFAQASV